MVWREVKKKARDRYMWTRHVQSCHSKPYKTPKGALWSYGATGRKRREQYVSKFDFFLVLKISKVHYINKLVLSRDKNFHQNRVPAISNFPNLTWHHRSVLNL